MSKLNVDDLHSRTWSLVKVHVDERLSTLRTRLEGSLSWEDTLQCRAQIRELKQLLEISQPEETPSLNTGD